MNLEKLRILLADIPPGKRIGAEPKDEAEHFYLCNACGQAVDRRDLAEVFRHEEPRHEARRPS